MNNFFEATCDICDMKKKSTASPKWFIVYWLVVFLLIYKFSERLHRGTTAIKNKTSNMPYCDPYRQL